MNLQDLDIVYFVKESKSNAELTYSLRSVDTNFPHKHVWFIGGKPDNLMPDAWIQKKQDKPTKWENTSSSLRCACMHPDISENFVMFNDDFFIMRPVSHLPYYAEGTLESRVQELKLRHPFDSTYWSRLESTASMLRDSGLPTINYAVHFPIIINKQEMLETFEAFPNGLMWRSIYGNHHRKPVRQIKDCKINSINAAPDTNIPYLSTQDLTFRVGLVGKYIQEIFMKPSRFEIKTD